MSMRSEDLPDPDGPTSPTLSPRAMASVMPRSTSTGPALPARVSRASARSRIVSAISAAFALPLRLGYGAAQGLRNLLLALVLLSPGLAAAEPVTIVALGDSLTQGYGLPPEEGFVPQLERWLKARGADAAVLNAGVSGDTSAGGLARTDWALVPEADAVIVTLGGNDMLRGLPPGELRANLDGILAKAGAKGLPVLLVAMTAPPNLGPEYKAAFDAVYPDVAAAHGALLADDFLAPLGRALNDGAAPGDLIQPDGLHPTARGVALIVQGLGPKVLELIARAGQI